MISNVEELRAEVRCSLANAEWRIPFLETRGYITRHKKDIGRAENSVSIPLAGPTYQFDTVSGPSSLGNI